ncbi:MAG: ChbG/HpnK family deacetylase [Ignavibacteriales bacterium]|nr:ChbG/HpnK family deacetylase [Ignavibacteriales bacterium]
MNKILISLMTLCLVQIPMSAQQNPVGATNAGKAIPILIRSDDWGMCHAVNMASKALIERGVPVSASVMFVCPWYQEAVELLRQHPDVSVGIHLTLNAEWKNYRWGPVAGAAVVPSLVDSLGFFFPSRSGLFANIPKLSEIEKELRAQVERAVHSGIRIDYLDYHMGAAVQTAETRAIVEKLAAEYHLAISRYFDEIDAEGIYAVPLEHKRDSLLAQIAALQQGGTKLFVFHIGTDTPEMQGMQDLNPSGPKDMSRQRQAELDALLSQEFHKLLSDGRYHFVTYRQMVEAKGLESMKRPK